MAIGFVACFQAYFDTSFDFVLSSCSFHCSGIRGQLATGCFMSVRFNFAFPILKRINLKAYMYAGLDDESAVYFEAGEMVISLEDSTAATLAEKIGQRI